MKFRVRKLIKGSHSPATPSWLYVMSGVISVTSIPCLAAKWILPTMVTWRGILGPFENVHGIRDARANHNATEPSRRDARLFALPYNQEVRSVAARMSALIC